MGLPSGVFAAQGETVESKFNVIRGSTQRSYSAGMAAAGNAGDCVVRTGNTGEITVSTDAAITVAGILGQDCYDPAALPASVASKIFADGILTYSKIGVATSVWKRGEFVLTNVNGAVGYGQYVIPDNNGAWKASATNTLTNGSIVCEVPNSTSGPITVSANLT